MISYRLPAIIEDSRIDKYLIVLQSLKKQNQLKLKFQLQTLISPAGYGILACLCDTAIERKSVIHWPTDNEVKSLHPYIIKLISIQKENNYLPNPNEYNFESENILFCGNEDVVDLGFIEKFEAKFQLNDDLLFDCKLILQELMQNAITHSGAERYFIYGGIWNNEIHCGLLDMGVSIPAKLRQAFEEENDIDYLLLAMNEGTSTRRSKTGGLGLYHFRSFLKKNKGKLTIVSGNAQVRHYFYTRNKQRSKLKHYLPGTWCFARMPYRKRR